MTIEELTDLDKLNEAFYQCSKISHWKESTQKYRLNIIENNLKLRDELRNGTYKLSPTTKFTLCERGKTRHIEAPAVRDRIVQKVLVHNVLLPAIRPTLIYDNYASLKGRGTSFARKRIDVMLRKFLSKYDDGYILQIDIRKYFDSIDHEVLKQLLRKRLNEPKEVMNLLEYLIDSTAKGLNLGSECPQIFAIFYLSGLDNWLKTVKGVKYYGRYMDDIFIMSPSKEYLSSLLVEIKEKLSELKLEVNDKKTHISKISNGFTFLQIKYGVNEGVFKRPTRNKITRERRRLKAFNGKMTANEIYNCYKSWKFAVIKDSPCCKKSMASLDKIFNALYSLTKTEKANRTKLYNLITKEMTYEDSKYIWRNCYQPRLY